MDDLENVDDSENDEDGFLICVLCYDEFTEDELYEHCCNKDYYIQGKIIKENYIQCKDCEYSTSTFHNLGRHTYKNHKPGGKDYKENVGVMRSVNAHYVNAFKDLQHAGELLDVTLASGDDILQAHKISAQTELMKCEFCEYSAHNFNGFEKHMYEKHRTGGGNDHKEIMVDTRSTSVQTELMKC